MKYSLVQRSAMLTLLIGIVYSHSASAQTSVDYVHGNLIQFSENGAWSWYQDERAVVDTANNQILIGSIANRGGYGGEAVDGHVRVTRFDLNTGLRNASVLGDIESYGGGDDHNVPGLLVKEDGDVLAFYAGHNNVFSVEDDRSFYRTLDASTQTWNAQSEYHWWDVIPANAPGSGGTTYSNVFQLSAEDTDGDGNGRLYNIARTQQSPHIMYSDDNGASWNYGGQLTKQNATPPVSSYVNGYYKYVSNGVDRIDIIATEYHPRDYNTSIYHAYIQGGKMYDSAGNVIDGDIFDAATSFNASNVTSTDDFTKVFQAGTTENSRAWNSDIQSYPDGSISMLFKARDGAFSSHTVGSNNHNVWFARFDPNTQTWSTHEIARAGASLFGGNETDYTGLGALDPNNPNVVYISTEIDPNTNTNLAHHEIYKGITYNKGATWAWTPITENSSYDNLRPIVPAWNEEETALIWWRGDMSSSQYFDTAVTGVVIRDTEQLCWVEYLDADLSNTTRADGLAFNPTTGSSQGAADNNWHLRTGFANGSNVFTADENDSESVPTLETTVTDLSEGTYDVFAYFWSAMDADWRILAGLSEDNLMVYRRRGSQQADETQFDTTLLLDEANRSLYRAYLGRIDLAQGESISVFIDDDSTADSGRIWYDGIGFAEVMPRLQGDINRDGFVGLDDLDIILNQWNMGTPPSGSIPTIPEPASAVILGVCSTAILRRRT